MVHKSFKEMKCTQTQLKSVPSKCTDLTIKCRFTAFLVNCNKCDT